MNKAEIAREKAEAILESIADYMGDREMFDNFSDACWYELEDVITDIIKKE